MIFHGKDFSDESCQPSLPSLRYLVIDMAGSFPHDGHFPVGQSFFQPMVSCRGFQFHTQGQQGLGWENFFFSRSGFIPYLTLSFPIDNLGVFLRFPLILYRSLGDGFVAKGEDFTLFDSFGLFLRWIGKDCGETSLHDFVPPSRLHELDFMTSYGMMYVPTNDPYVFDLSLLWFMMKHGCRYSNTMQGRFYWLYDYT
jgi:hypothetical protein